MWRLLWFATLLCRVGDVAGDAEKRAFATLLYGEDFLLGVRVLGQSIRDTHTEADLVVIVTGSLSRKSEKTLRSDGWIVHRVDAISNPGRGPQRGKGFPDRFSAVYTKLTVFNLTSYDKVVYLDADTLMLGAADELFSCPGFCAAQRHSERFNSGVMVVTPSTTLYDDMLDRIATVPSYTGGDQGFLNVYFKDLIDAPLFVPGQIAKDAEMMRLPTGYNADIGLYLFNSNRWMIPRDKIKIVHYTLGPFKPWNWWTPWVITDVKAWQAARHRLPTDAHGLSGGVSRTQRFWTHVLSWVPLLLMGLMYYKYLRPEAAHTLSNGKSEAVPSTSSASLTHSLMAKTGLPKRFVGNSIWIGFASLLLPLCTVLALVPKEILPFWGWLLAYEWVLFLHALLFSLYLKYSHDTGRAANSANLPTFKFASWSNPWRVTVKSGVVSAALMILCPVLPSCLFVSSVFVKLGVAAVGVVVLCVFLTHAYSTLPVRWFAYGRNEGTGKTSSY